MQANPNLSESPRETARPKRQGRMALRWISAFGAALIALIVIAYIDGGEEPLRPITEEVDLATVSGRPL